MGVKMKQIKQGLVPKLRFREFEKDGEWEKKSGNKLFDPISNKKHNSDLPILAITQEHGAIPRDKIDYRVSVTDKSIESYKVVELGDFIISLRSFQGGIEYSTYKGLCSPAYIILRRKRDDHEGFFKHYLKTNRFIKDLNKDIEGIRDGKMVSYDQFSNILIPMPQSKKEQQKIADCLSSLDELIEAEDQKLEALQRHKKGLMQELFPADGETLPRLRFPEFQSAPEWEEKPFSNFIKLYRGSSPRPIQEFLTKNNDGVNWIKIGDTKFSSNFIIGKVEEKITKKGAERSRFVEIGELILANSMSYGKTYQLAINGCIYDGWFVLREYEDFFYKPFLLQLLNSDFMQKQYESLSAGGIVQNISSEVVYSSKLFHTSIPEQARIADFLISIDEIINTQTKKLESLRLHKKGLMQQLFPNHNQEEIINHNKP
jgi:type I restriction enzyme S subunit